MADQAAPAGRSVVVMGVSGCGKSTVAEEIARRTGWTLAEGDEFHPAANVAKMRSGTPLTDEDREPWLRTIAAWISVRHRRGENVVVTCSALKRAYRDILRTADPAVFFVHLDAPREVLLSRLQARTEHFMPATLLQSQLDTLEPLGTDEAGTRLSVAGPFEEVVAAAMAALVSPGTMRA